MSAVRQKWKRLLIRLEIRQVSVSKNVQLSQFKDLIWQSVFRSCLDILSCSRTLKKAYTEWIILIKYTKQNVYKKV